MAICDGSFLPPAIAVLPWIAFIACPTVAPGFCFWKSLIVPPNFSGAAAGAVLFAAAASLPAWSVGPPGVLPRPLPTGAAGCVLSSFAPPARGAAISGTLPAEGGVDGVEGSNLLLAGGWPACALGAAEPGPLGIGDDGVALPLVSAPTGPSLDIFDPSDEDGTVDGGGAPPGV